MKKRFEYFTMMLLIITLYSLAMNYLGLYILPPFIQGGLLFITFICCITYLVFAFNDEKTT